MVRVADVMRRTPPSIDRGECAGRPARQLAREGLSALPVTHRGALVGVLAEADLAAVQPSPGTTLSVGEIAAHLDGVPVASLLDGRVTAVGPRTPLADAIALMRAQRLSALPVVRGPALIGLLAEDDLLDVLAEQLDEPPWPRRPATTPPLS